MMKQLVGSVFVVLMALSSLILPSALDDQNTELLYFDDFESNTVKWLGVGSGTVTRSEVMAFTGGGSLNITANAGDIQEALFMIGTPRVPLPVLALDFWFSVPSTGLDYFCFGLEISSANRDSAFCGGIIFPHGRYLNNSDVWTDIEGLAGLGWDLSDDYSVWHHAVLKMDISTGEYIEVSIDDFTVDMASFNYVANEKPRYYWGIIYPWFYSGGSSTACSILIDNLTLYLISD
jgi:hypothetical protein